MRVPFLLCLTMILLYSCKQSDGIDQNENKELTQPNIIFIMADDLGYADLGVFGQKVIQTPNIDQMATEGRIYTQCYAGSPVCAPSRSTLMTGLHTGHTTVRGNKSPVPVPANISPNPVRVPLFAEDITVAEVLKAEGYVTGMFGKWGLGEHGSAGEPND
ncbi:MAG: sulfatase-like hydrolase/transferase, partial [Bacteroidota bacterium]